MNRYQTTLTPIAGNQAPRAGTALVSAETLTSGYPYSKTYLSAQTEYN